MTSAPTMWAPRSWPVFLSKIVLTMPWSSPSAIALPLPTKGKRPTRMSLPSALALASVRPTEGDLRAAVGAAGDFELVHRVDVGQAGDLLDADDRLVLGLVRQHRRAGDVADGVDARHVGAAIAVDDDGAALDLHAERLQAEVLDIALDADRRDHPVGGDRLGLAVLQLDMRGDRDRGPSRPSSPWPRAGSSCPASRTAFSRRSAISVSSTGMTCGMISTTVTSTPIVR